MVRTPRPANPRGRSGGGARSAAPRTAAARPRTPAEIMPPAPERAVMLAWIAFALLVAISYGYVLRLGFGNDDYLVLDEILLRWPGRALLWSAQIAGYWRPWSRELHVLALTKAVGERAGAFHAVNVLLWLAVLAAALALVRRVSDARTAVLAVSAAFAASAWGVFLAWASCAQDLWMLLFGLLFLHARLSHRRVLAPLALAFALLSKETGALMLPAAAWMEFTLRGRDALRLRAWTGPLAVTLLWALVHPSLGGHAFLGSTATFGTSHTPGRLVPALRSMLAPLNIEHGLAPRGGWGPALLEGAAWALLLGGVAWSVLANVPERGTVPPQRGRTLRLGLGWWVIGWLPLLVPAYD